MRAPAVPSVSLLTSLLDAVLLLFLGLIIGIPALEAAEPQAISWVTPAEGAALRLNESTPLLAAASSGLPVSFRVVTGPAVIEGGAVKATGIGTIQVVAEQPGNADYLPVSLTRTFNRPVSMGTRLAVVDTPGAPMDIVVRDGFAFVADGPGGFQIIDVRNPLQPVIVGSLPPIGSTGPEHVAVQGQYAFLGEETRGLRIVDISNLSTPKDVTVFPSQNWVIGLALSGNRVFLTEYQYGLEIVDITNPTQPVALARYPVPGQARRVWADGDLAYLAIDRVPGELQVLNLVDPTHPEVLGSTEISPFARDFQGQGRYAFLASNSAGLQPIDLGDPRNPVAYAPIPSGEAWGIEVSSDRAYQSGSQGLVVFDISNPVQPVRMGTYPPIEPSGAAAIVGDLAYLTVGRSGVELVRLREGLAQTLQFDPPTRVPTSTTTLNLTATASSGLPVEFAVVAGPASISGGSVSITGSGTITVRASQAGDVQFNPVQVDRTIQVADVPVIATQPAPINLPSGGSGSVAVEVQGGGTLTYQWIRDGSKVSGSNKARMPVSGTDNFRGLWQVIISNAAGSVTSHLASVTHSLPAAALPELPGVPYRVRTRGSLPGFTLGFGSGAPIRWQIRGTLAYVVNGWETQLRVISLEDPDRPVEVSRVDIPNQQSGFDIALIDDTALVVERAGGLGIYDLTNPLFPLRIGVLRLPGSLANSITVRDRTAFVGNEDAGIVVLDVDDPRSPKVIGKAAVSGSVNGLDISFPSAFSAGWGTAITMVDITNPTQPTVLGRFPASGTGYPGTAFDVISRGSIVYVADTQQGVLTVDFTDPGAARLVGRQAGSVWGLHRLPRHLFTADGTGVRVFDISNPTNTVPAGSLRAFGPALGVSLHGNRLIQIGNQLGLSDLSFEAQPPVLSNEPEWRRVGPGRTVTLHAPATGTEPMSWTWFHDGKPVGEGPSLKIENLTASRHGVYSVTVTGAAGTTSGVVARLEAPAGPRIIPGTTRFVTGVSSGFRFDVDAPPGSRFAVMRSTDLVQWQEVSVETALAGATPVIDTQPSTAARFYRIETR
ncbi:MAG: immunoglobulin domain-containing protein [Limisphaerales bacterium]